MSPPWKERFYEPIHPSSLAFLRAGAGLILLWEAVRFLTSNRIEVDYLQPTIHFTYLGFDWVRPWPGDGLYYHFAGLGVLGLLIALGFLTRISAVLFFLGFAYVFLLDQARYLNHFYLVLLLSLLLIFAPTHYRYSIDALIRRKRKRKRKATPRWVLLLFRTQIGLVYFYAGIAKINPDWLSGEPLRTWLRARGDMAFIGDLLTWELTAWVFSYGAVLLDLLAWPLLLYRPTRTLVFWILVGFHLMNSILFGIGIFPWLMIVATTIFFAPNWPLAFWQKPPGSQMDPKPVTEPPRQSLLVLVLVVLYLSFQMLFPLRHFLYPGRVHWTEEGHRFSWHMMLRTKRSVATFLVTQPETGESWLVDPKVDLETWQARRMAGRPDMILQYARWVADRYRKEGKGNVSVRATVKVSLNSHPPQLLIDPDIDLAKEKRSLAPARWILPQTK